MTEGNVYIQWHRRDNAGRVEILQLEENDEVKTDFVPGTETAINIPGLLGFASVSRARRHWPTAPVPEHGFGLCRHAPDAEKAEVLSEAPSISPPDRHQGARPLRRSGRKTSRRADRWRRSAIVPDRRGRSRSPRRSAFSDGRIYAACEDGYLYVFGPNGKAPLPEKDLGCHRGPQSADGAEGG